LCGKSSYRIDREHPLVQSVLERAGSLRDDLGVMLRLLEETVPVQQIWLDAAERPEVHARPFGGVADADVRRAMTSSFRALLRTGLNVRQARDRLHLLVPFDEHPDLIESLEAPNPGGST
jgi:hypothetical protein